MADKKSEASVVSRLSDLENKVHDLQHKIDKILSLCEKMDNHVEFVETQYNRFKNSLNFVNRYLGFSLESSDEEYKEEPKQITT